MNEAQLQEAVVELAHLLGWQHLHVRRSIGKGRQWTTATNVPWPDLTLWHPTRGGFLVRELKVPKGAGGTVLRSQWQPGQAEVLAELLEAGVDAAVWTPADLDNGRVQRELTPWRATGAA